ncbi:hypothetical protein GYMLUDRAFT_46424 [Collybiopsis luxurians FD-317 M1]|uniref:Unplaced genomic scaffold GYMLUscaffold_44, whole genome shotgun sequence n=1 Tax=Collybiopsis luxurians FD-317 M1 TaxID=944289 RepID=A0A0D0BQ11_9AGAR|nr:hypothetical protein GYMLUDRAFT_46424 [Collybiopsis luxurians FD-317 M1]
MAEDQSSLQLQPQATLDHSLTCTPSAGSISFSLKRPASLTFEGVQDTTSRKRFKDAEQSVDDQSQRSTIIESKLADDIAQELECGCCSELIYKPVMVSPCQHFFCGSCCQLWIRNGGTTCPACRSISTTASPSRPLQLVLDALLRNAPHKARTERERAQADEIYRTGNTLRFPSPREASPEPNVNISSEYARPCPHCPPNNPYGWSCPIPIPDPAVDLEHAWHLDDGIPTGHSQCGNCETFLALRAPSTTRCDFCHVSFCGVGVPQRCSAAPILLQHPHGFNDLSDLIQSADVYDYFQGNTVEVDIMLDYLTAQEITPRHVYREVVKHTQEQPQQFKAMIESGIFSTDAHIDPSIDTSSSSSTPPSRICRQCACEIFLNGLKEWWIRERKKGFVEQSVMDRKDCPDGSECNMQKDYAHAREFNHIFARPISDTETPNSASALAMPAMAEPLGPFEAVTGTGDV